MIMRNNILKLISLMTLASLVSCSSDEINEIQDMTPQKIEIKASYADVPISRSALTPNVSGLTVNWSKNDMLCLMQNTEGNYESTELILHEGEGKKTGIFTGSGLPPKQQPAVYQGFYPASIHGKTPEEWMTNASYAGQVQRGYDNADHLGVYDYMISEDLDDLSKTMKFYHTGVVFCFDITLPQEEDSYPVSFTLMTTDAAGKATSEGGLFCNCHGDKTNMQTLNFEQCEAGNKHFKAYMISNCNIKPGQTLVAILNMYNHNRYEHQLTCKEAVTSDRADKTISGSSYVVPISEWTKSEHKILNSSTSESRCDGEGTAESPYLIKEGANLLYLVSNMAFKKENYYRLECDIEIQNEYAWKGIGTADRPFQGHFDGQGHTIYGKIKYVNAKNYGLFNDALDATITNLNLQLDIVCSCNHMGALVGRCTNTTITNCHHNGSIIINDGQYLGGLVGDCLQGSCIHGCTSRGSISKSKEGTKQETDMGGICGSMSTSSKIEKCQNYKTVTLENYSQNYSRMGGILGFLSREESAPHGHIWMCSNHGKVNIKNLSSQQTYLGGIVGYGRYITVCECLNEGSIIVEEKNSENAIGGICGNAYRHLNLLRCINRGNIQNMNSAWVTYSGGLAGKVEEDAGTIHQCLNEGNVCQLPAGTHRASKSASFIGYCKKENVIFNCCTSGKNVEIKDGVGEVVSADTPQFYIGNATTPQIGKCNEKHNKIK